MRVIRNGFIALCLLLGMASAAVARVNIDINLSLFPELVRVPGYPVYYAPQEDENYFFYDGMYWVYEDDDWYVSDWYNGPWEYVDPDDVPVFLLRIPVRYYRRPPAYFRGWVYDEPPRWGQHWGHDWESNHRDWNRWDRRHSPAPAPLPDYQRHYSRDRYPDRDEQREIRDHSNYRYQPRDVNVQPHYRQSSDRAPEPRDEQNRQQNPNRRAAPQSGGSHDSPQRNREAAQPQQQQEPRDNNLQRRTPVIESPRGQQNTERNAPSPQANERGNVHPARGPQEQRQQPAAPQQREHGGQERHDPHGDNDSHQDEDRGGKR